MVRIHSGAYTTKAVLQRCSAAFVFVVPPALAHKKLRRRDPVNPPVPEEFRAAHELDRRGPITGLLGHECGVDQGMGCELDVASLERSLRGLHEQPPGQNQVACVVLQVRCLGQAELRLWITGAQLAGGLDMESRDGEKGSPPA